MKIFVAYIAKINIQQNIINSSCRMTRVSQTMLHPTWAIQWDLFCLHVYFEGTDTVQMDRHRSWWFISVSSYCMSQKNPIVKSSKMNGWGKENSLILRWGKLLYFQWNNLCTVKFLSDISNFENIDIELELKILLSLQGVPLC